MNKKGNILIFSLIIIAVIVILFLWIVYIFVSEINSLLYNIKLDMYSINKSAIIAVNKGITSREYFNYDEKTYRQYFENMLIKNYKLDSNLENKEGIIRKVNIIEYEIYNKGKIDNHTNKKTKDIVIHSVIKVYIKPILFSSKRENLWNFIIHEDVNLNTVSR